MIAARKGVFVKSFTCKRKTLCEVKEITDVRLVFKNGRRYSMNIAILWLLFSVSDRVASISKELSGNYCQVSRTVAWRNFLSAGKEL